jgi:hypothetical protein
VLVLAPGVQIANQDFDNLAGTYTKHFKGAPTVILHQCVVFTVTPVHSFPCDSSMLTMHCHAIRFPMTNNVTQALCHSFPGD